MTLLFWISLLLVFYVYLGYPVLLRAGVLGKRRRYKQSAMSPFVSILIPAFNEERGIRAKLENLLNLDYDPDLVEILVGSDGSDDATPSIVREFEEAGVQLIHSRERRGKSATQNEIVAAARGTILVFTDADCFLPSNALSEILTHFADPQVGLVTSSATISNERETGVVQSEGLYWKYERWLREEESARGLLAMASGSLFAMRRELWRPLERNVGDDFALPLFVVRQEKLNVVDRRVSARTRLTQSKPGLMLRMKVRIISKDLRGLLKNTSCLNPFAAGRVAIALWSHKLLRWAVPYFLIGLLVSSVALRHQPLYGSVFDLQVVFYGLSVIGFAFGTKRFHFPFSVASSFCLVNFAALIGTLHCLSRRRAGVWKPVR